MKKLLPILIIITMTACNSSPKDAVEIIFTHQMTMADLDSIKNMAAERDVKIEYLGVQTNASGTVDSISFQVVCLNFFSSPSGSYSAVLTDSMAAGFYINDAHNAILLGSDAQLSNK